MSSPEFKTMKARSTQYASVAVAHTKDFRAWASNNLGLCMEAMRNQASTASKHAAGIHSELVDFIQKLAEDTPDLKPYADRSSVSILVTAMMLSPFCAVLLPACLWVCRSFRSRHPHSAIYTAQTTKSKANKPKSRPQPNADNGSPVGRTEKGVIEKGGDRVKFGKPITEKKSTK